MTVSPGATGAALLLLPWLLVVGGLYARGTALLWHNAGVGKGVSIWQALSFFTGLLTLLAAVASPLDALAHALFSGHMAQHMLLVLVTAPLLAYGAPVLAVLWALPRRWRLAVGRWWLSTAPLRAAWRLLTHPLTVWLLFAVALWAWHLPVLYQFAVVSPIVHALEHFSLLVASYLFWWLVLQPTGRRTLGHGGAILFVFTASIHITLLGALLSIATAPLYPIYEPGAELFGLQPLADQRLAAVVMRTPMAFAFLLVVAVLFLRWLALMEQRADGYGSTRKGNG